VGAKEAAGPPLQKGGYKKKETLILPVLRMYKVGRVLPAIIRGMRAA
jgi:hypothetical protein